MQFKTANFRIICINLLNRKCFLQFVCIIYEKHEANAIVIHFLPGHMYFHENYHICVEL